MVIFQIYLSCILQLSSDSHKNYPRVQILVAQHFVSQVDIKQQNIKPKIEPSVADPSIKTYKFTLSVESRYIELILILIPDKTFQRQWQLALRVHKKVGFLVQLYSDLGREFVTKYLLNYKARVNMYIVQCTHIFPCLQLPG